MKYGVIVPAEQAGEDQAAQPGPRLGERLRAWRKFMLIVIAPTLAVAGYYYLIAADQYVSEAHFIVKSGDNAPAAPSGFGALLGLTGGPGQTQSEIMSVPDYLQSHDVVATLQAKLGLTQIFRRPEADLISRMWSDAPAPETLLKFYRSKVKVGFDKDTGIADLTVRTFRPDDSFAVARALLELGEQRVNAMNTRSYRDALASAQQQLVEAERAGAAIQRRVTAFRQGQRDIDPQASGATQIKLVSELSGRLAGLRAQLATTGATLSHSSPQYIALSRQVQSLAAQVNAESGRLTGNAGAIAGSLGDFEDLQVRQDYAKKSYEAAAANLQRASEDARRQQLYLVRVVDANLPVKSLYPERTKTVLTVFFTLLIAYAIGWLIAAGVKEHEG